MHLVWTVSQAEGPLPSVHFCQRKDLRHPSTAVDLNRVINHLKGDVRHRNLDLGDF